MKKNEKNFKRENDCVSNPTKRSDRSSTALVRLIRPQVQLVSAKRLMSFPISSKKKTMVYPNRMRPC